MELNSLHCIALHFDLGEGVWRVLLCLFLPVLRIYPLSQNDESIRHEPAPPPSRPGLIGVDMDGLQIEGYAIFEEIWESRRY